MSFRSAQEYITPTNLSGTRRIHKSEIGLKDGTRKAMPSGFKKTIGIPQEDFASLKQQVIKELPSKLIMTRLRQSKTRRLVYSARN